MRRRRQMRLVRMHDAAVLTSGSFEPLKQPPTIPSRPHNRKHMTFVSPGHTTPFVAASSQKTEKNAPAPRFRTVPCPGAGDPPDWTPPRAKCGPGLNGSGTYAIFGGTARYARPIPYGQTRHHCSSTANRGSAGAAFVCTRRPADRQVATACGGDRGPCLQRRSHMVGDRSGAARSSTDRRWHFALAHWADGNQ